MVRDGAREDAFLGHPNPFCCDISKRACTSLLEGKERRQELYSDTVAGVLSTAAEPSAEGPDSPGYFGEITPPLRALGPPLS